MKAAVLSPPLSLLMSTATANWMSRRPPIRLEALHFSKAMAPVLLVQPAVIFPEIS